MNINDYKNQNCECGKPQRAKPRFLTHRVSEAEAGRSVQSLLRNEMQLSGGLVARLKRVENGITLNGAKVFSNVRAAEGDIIAAAIGFCPERCGKLPFEVLFEDEDLLIINKPAGAAVHGSRYDDSVPSIELAVNEYYGDEGFFHPVSRLDRGTTGVMTIAKNGYMHERLSACLHTDSYVRFYIGICHGWLGANTGTVDMPIKREDGPSVRRVIDPCGAEAITDFRLLKDCGFNGCRGFAAEENEQAENIVIKKENDAQRYENKSGLIPVEFRLRTGRTHQIRVHAAAVGHPLAGDWLYGTEEPELIGRPALHSYRLEFVHPLRGEKLCIKAELPRDMQKLLSRH